MLLNILYTCLFIALIFSIVIVNIRRKKVGVTGIKSALTTICLFYIAHNFTIFYQFILSINNEVCSKIKIL